MFSIFKSNKTNSSKNENDPKNLSSIEVLSETQSLEENSQSTLSENAGEFILLSDSEEEDNQLSDGINEINFLSNFANHNLPTTYKCLLGEPRGPYSNSSRCLIPVNANAIQDAISVRTDSQSLKNTITNPIGLKNRSQKVVSWPSIVDEVIIIDDDTNGSKDDRPTMENKELLCKESSDKTHNILDTRQKRYHQNTVSKRKLINISNTSKVSTKNKKSKTTNLGVEHLKESLCKSVEIDENQSSAVTENSILQVTKPGIMNPIVLGCVPSLKRINPHNAPITDDVELTSEKEVSVSIPKTYDNEVEIYEGCTGDLRCIKTKNIYSDAKGDLFREVLLMEKREEKKHTNNLDNEHDLFVSKVIILPDHVNLCIGPDLTEEVITTTIEMTAEEMTKEFQVNENMSTKLQPPTNTSGSSSSRRRSTRVENLSVLSNKYKIQIKNTVDSYKRLSSSASLYDYSYNEVYKLESRDTFRVVESNSKDNMKRTLTSQINRKIILKTGQSKQNQDNGAAIIPKENINTKTTGSENLPSTVVSSNNSNCSRSTVLQLDGKKIKNDKTPMNLSNKTQNVLCTRQKRYHRNTVSKRKLINISNTSKVSTKNKKSKTTNLGVEHLKESLCKSVEIDEDQSSAVTENSILQVTKPGIMNPIVLGCVPSLKRINPPNAPITDDIELTSEKEVSVSIPKTYDNEVEIYEGCTGDLRGIKTKNIYSDAKGDLFREVLLMEKREEKKHTNNLDNEHDLFVSKVIILPDHVNLCIGPDLTEEVITTTIEMTAEEMTKEFLVNENMSSKLQPPTNTSGSSSSRRRSTRVENLPVLSNKYKIQIKNTVDSYKRLSSSASLYDYSYNEVYKLESRDTFRVVESNSKDNMIRTLTSQINRKIILKTGQSKQNQDNGAAIIPKENINTKTTGSENLPSTVVSSNNSNCSRSTVLQLDGKKIKNDKTPMNLSNKTQNVLCTRQKRYLRNTVSTSKLINKSITSKVSKTKKFNKKAISESGRSKQNQDNGAAIIPKETLVLIYPCPKRQTTRSKSSPKKNLNKHSVSDNNSGKTSNVPALPLYCSPSQVKQRSTDLMKQLQVKPTQKKTQKLVTTTKSAPKKRGRKRRIDILN